MSERVYCLGENTGCDHEDKPTLEECSDCPYMTTSEPMSEQDELLLTQKEIDIVDSKGVIEGDIVPYLQAQLAKVKQHNDDKRLSFLEQFLQFTPTPSLEAIIDLIKTNKSLGDTPFVGQSETQKRLDRPDREKMTRQVAKKHLCGGCTGTRQSGSYFSNECKDDALKCHRIDLFIRGYETALIPDIEELQETIAYLEEAIQVMPECLEEEAKKQGYQQALYDIGKGFINQALKKTEGGS